MTSSPITAAVFKPSSTFDAGVTFYDDRDGKIFIDEVQEGGLFEQTDLRAGMEVISINNNSTEGMFAITASEIINEAEGTVSILAQEAPPQEQFAAGVVVEQHPSSYVVTPTAPPPPTTNSTASPPPSVVPTANAPQAVFDVPHQQQHEKAPASSPIVLSAELVEEEQENVDIIDEEANDSPVDNLGVSTNEEPPRTWVDDTNFGRREREKPVVCCNMTKCTLIMVCCGVLVAFIAGGTIATYFISDGFKFGSSGDDDFDDDLFIGDDDDRRPSRPIAPPTSSPTSSPTLSPTSRILGLCEGDCDSHSDCAGSLLCYPSSWNGSIGCSGLGSSDDFCYYPSLNNYGSDGHVGRTLGLCEGDCDFDSHCAGSLICYQRETGDGGVPGCYGTPVSYYDYCIDPSLLLLKDYGVNGHVGRTLGFCEGDCDSDSHCAGSLICYQRETGDGDVPPGCSGTPVPYHDYCISP